MNFLNKYCLNNFQKCCYSVGSDISNILLMQFGFNKVATIYIS